jgi:diaminobutyrate-2-oxoglutarate transaminase
MSMSTAVRTTTKAVPDAAVFERRESNVRSYCRSFDSVFVAASGSVMYDVEGGQYLDFLAGAGSLNYGHNDPDMKAALIDHLARDGIAHSLDLHTVSKGAFLEAFEDLVLAPRELDYRVQFTGPTGANAVEASLKLARKLTGRSNVIAFTNAFHGVTQGALAATGNGAHRRGAGTPLTGVSRLPYEGYLGPDVDTVEVLERMLADPSSGLDEPAAVLVETVQGEGGLNVASPQWLKRIARVARAYGAMLIIDDVQAGCGRTGTFFSFEAAGIVPDMVVLSKSISGFGIPMAILLVRPELDVWSPGEHNGTFRGNNHAFVTATVALEKFWEDSAFAREVDDKGELVQKHLEAIADALPDGRVKGRGMMRGLDTGSGEVAAEISRVCFEHGLIVETSGPHDEVVKILAPLTTTTELLERGLGILLDSVDATSVRRLSKGA